MHELYRRHSLYFRFIKSLKVCTFLILRIDGLHTSCEIGFMWMIENAINDNSIVVRVMDWWLQTTSHYVNQLIQIPVEHKRWELLLQEIKTYSDTEFLDFPNFWSKNVKFHNMHLKQNY